MSEFQHLSIEQRQEFKEIEEAMIASVAKELNKSEWDFYILNLRLAQKRGDKVGEIPTRPVKSWSAKAHGLLRGEDRYSTFEVVVKNAEQNEMVISFEELDTDVPRKAQIEIAEIEHKPFVVYPNTRYKLDISQMLEIITTAHEATEGAVQNCIDEIEALEDTVK